MFLSVLCIVPNVVCVSVLCLVPNVVCVSLFCVLFLMLCVSLSSSPQVLSCGVRVVHFVHYLFLRSKIRVVMFGTMYGWPLHPVVCSRRADVVFMSFVFVCV